MNKALSILISVLVATVVVIGLAIVGSPSEQRMLSLDKTRVKDLRKISSDIEGRWNRIEELPSELQVLVDGIHMESLPLDPETDQPYEYQARDSASFDLCGTFALPSGPAKDSSFWDHPEGRHCFEFELDPDQSSDEDSN